MDSIVDEALRIDGQATSFVTSFVVGSVTIPEGKIETPILIEEVCDVLQMTRSTVYCRENIAVLTHRTSQVPENVKDKDELAAIFRRCRAAVELRLENGDKASCSMGVAKQQCKKDQDGNIVRFAGKSICSHQKQKKNVHTRTPSKLVRILAKTEERYTIHSRTT